MPLRILAHDYEYDYSTSSSYEAMSSRAVESPWWTLLEGSDYCRVYDNCVHSKISYGSNEECTVKAMKGMYLYSPKFHTESWDTLTIKECTGAEWECMSPAWFAQKDPPSEFSGSYGPDELWIDVGDAIAWESDSSLDGHDGYWGFVVCGGEQSRDEGGEYEFNSAQYDSYDSEKFDGDRGASLLLVIGLPILAVLSVAMFFLCVFQSKKKQRARQNEIKRLTAQGQAQARAQAAERAAKAAERARAQQLELTPAGSQAQTTSGDVSVADELTQLSVLHERGILNDAQFESAKDQVLGKAHSAQPHVQATGLPMAYAMQPQVVVASTTYGNQMPVVQGIVL